MQTRVTGRSARVEQLERRTLRSAGVVTGTVFADANGDGNRDRGEVGQAGQTVWADLNGNGGIDAGEPADVTAADGTYALRGVPAGPVTVRQVQGAGLRETVPYDGAGHPAVVRAAATTAGVNCGATANLYVAGVVYADRNGDGIREPGEPPMAGVPVYAVVDGGGRDEPYRVGDPTAVTGRDGSYHIDSLPPTPGEYAFDVAPPAGYGLPVRTDAQFFFGGFGSDGVVLTHVGFGLAPLVGSVAVAGGTLTVTGTAVADTVTVANVYGGPIDAALVTIDGAGRWVDASAVYRLVIDAGGGDDRVDFTGLPGAPAGLATTVLGGAGDDALDVIPTGDPTATVVVSGGDGDDTIAVGGDGETAVAHGDAGNDQLSAAGPAGRATLDGGSGDDTLAAGVALELVTLVGGAGNDTATVSAVNYAGSYPATEPSTLALDSRPHAGSGVVFGTDVENLTGTWPVAVNVVGNAAANRLDVRADGPETVVGLGGNDTLVAGDGGPATLSGGDGTDALYAADGGPTVVDGGSGTNTAFADAGDIVTHAAAISRPPPGALPGTPLGSDPNVLAAFDGDPNTFYAGGKPVGLDLGTAKVLTAVTYAPRPGRAARMVGGTFQGSDDPTFATGVSPLYTVKTAPPTGRLTTAAVAGGEAYRYVRYVGPAGSDDDVAEVRFVGGPVPFAFLTIVAFADANANGRADPGEVDDLYQNVALTQVASADGRPLETLSLLTADRTYRLQVDPGTYEVAVPAPDGERVTTFLPGQITVAAGVTTVLYVGFAPVAGSAAS